MQPWQYIVLLGAVILVGVFIMPGKKTKAVFSSQTVRNMESALDQFMENMEKENEQLMQLMTDYQQASKLDAAKKDERIAALEARCEQLEEQLNKSFVRLTKAEASQEANAQATKSVFDLQKQNNIQARFAELLQMHADGQSIEAIAKKLEMNKGEVLLIIGLSKQEAAVHA